MRRTYFAKGLAFGMLAGVSWAAFTPHAHAQQALCPANVLVKGADNSGFALQGGLCTNGATGAFSGAALATQALTELSQTQTQESAKNTQTSITTRRDEEMRRCPEGFTRVDGACERIRPAVSEAAPPPVPPVPEEEPVARKKKKATVAVGAPVREPATRVVPRERLQPPVPEPIPVEPPVRFASWTQLYGDYERRSAQGSTFVGGVGAGFVDPAANIDPQALPLSARSRAGTVGFLFGGDATVRGIFGPDDGLIGGVLLGYMSSHVNVTTSSGPTGPATTSALVAQSPSEFPLMGPGSSDLNANLSGLTTGVYGTYFNGGFSADFLLKADVLTLNQTINEVLSFTNPNVFAVDPTVSTSPITRSFSTSGRFSLVNTTLAGGLNYRFILNPYLWLEPTVGALWTHSAYGNGAQEFGLADADLVRVQGGARVGIPVMINAHTLMTTTLTGLAYSDVLVAGGFIPGASFLATNLFAQADQGQVRGRGIAAVTFDYGNGVSSFIQGEARGGKGLFGAGGRAGIRIVW